MKQLLATTGTVAATLSLLAFALPASAQVYTSNYGGLADVSYANGATIVRGDSGTQIAATMNTPLATGDYFASGPGSAEIQFDGNSMLRLASNSQVRIVNLNPGSRELQVASGTVDLAELSGASGSPQVDTPTLTLRPQRSGDYRVTVLGNGETLVTVRRGAATVSTSNGTQTLTPGSTLVSYGGNTNFENAVGFDSFDNFNASRDQNVVSAYNGDPYLSPDLAGYSNLSNYGQWQNIPGYGYSWAPNNQVADNYAPYQNGQWVWEPGYGYTWVDNAPYGYETSHYGSWFYNNNYGGWNWQPPGYQYQNTSASLASIFVPAAVSFFLNGGNGTDLASLLEAGLTSNFYGNPNTDIGWIPLAPGEQYQPWYGQDYAYPTTAYYSVPNVTNVYNYYTNARYYRGVTMVPVSAWREGRFSERIVPRPNTLRRIVLIRGAVPITPTTTNLYVRANAPRRNVVLAKQFRAPRLVARAPAMNVRSFAEQRSRVATITTIRPKVEAFRAPATHIMRTVYRAPARSQMHYVAARPMPPLRTNTKTRVNVRARVNAPMRAPAQRHEIQQHAAPVRHEVIHRTIAPAKRPVGPVQRPAERRPVERPVAPMEHPAAPVRHEVIHRTIAPAERPVAPPVQRPESHSVLPPVEQRPATRPAAPAEQRPVEQRPVEEKRAERKEAPHEKPTPRPIHG